MTAKHLVQVFDTLHFESLTTNHLLSSRRSWLKKLKAHIHHLICKEIADFRRPKMQKQQKRRKKEKKERKKERKREKKKKWRCKLKIWLHLTVFEKIQKC